MVATCMLTQQKPVWQKHKGKTRCAERSNQENIQRWREKNRDFDFWVLASHEVWLFWEQPSHFIYKFPSLLKLMKVGFFLSAKVLLQRQRDVIKNNPTWVKSNHVVDHPNWDILGAVNNFTDTTGKPRCVAIFPMSSRKEMRCSLLMFSRHY